MRDSGRHETLRAWAHHLLTREEGGSGGYAVRIFFNPLVRFIWLGALIMFCGGGISLSDRRLRVGAPGRARRLLVVTGLLFVTGSMNGLGNWMLETFPQLGRLEESMTPKSLQKEIMKQSDTH